MEKDNSSVQVALRVRPLVDREQSQGCKNIVEIFSDLHQVKIKNSNFTYNYVFGPETPQDKFYLECVAPMLENLYKGYNMTILAYGQTGSGKTHSMGTAYNGDGEMGIIPRAINDIFAYVKDNFSYDFTINVTFMELYQEVLYDLLSTKGREESMVEIREDVSKQIIIPGLTEKIVSTPRETLDLLIKGSLGRATSSTNMNSQSSRSHAIFTINLLMQKKGDSNFNKTAKFHLVDLAGSERSKKTGATGQTFKEGVNINKGLLALGNVISALGDEKGQNGYIGYRDSNLTRLLKDSLGGNSITLMIACISPADYNFEESMSTCRYADRARKIKNKPIVNQDPKAAEINRLNKLVQQLRLELLGQGGPVICHAEVEIMKKELDESKGKNKILNSKLAHTLMENAALMERLLIIQSSNEELTKKLHDLMTNYNITIDNLNLSLSNNDFDGMQEHVNNFKNIQDQLIALEKEHKMNETEIKKHEMAVSKNTLENAMTSEKEISDRQECHTVQQMEMNVKLQEVNKILAQKEDLAQQIAANICHMVDHTEFSENQSKISSLEKEKEELLQLLKSAQEHTNTNDNNKKVNEMRRKRVKELETQIQDLNRKIKEQDRLIKMKEKDEQKIRQLNNEITTMKSTRVKLIKNMRQESEKFRVWKVQRERELSKLKDNDRKLQNRIVKMETIHTRQQNVLRRKVEEAAAINKRLKDALVLRKTAQDNRMNGKIESFGPWIQRELDVFISIIEARSSLEVLIEDRAALQHQLDRLIDNNAPEPEMSALREDIDLRSVQIGELQQKLLDSDEDNHKSRFDKVQSMSEAKYVIKVLFDLTADIKKQEANKNYEMQLEIDNKIKEERHKLEDMFRDEIAHLEQSQEEKVSVLLRQLRGVEIENLDEEIKKRCSIQNETIGKLEKAVESLETKYKQSIESIAEINVEKQALLDRNDELTKLLEEKTAPKKAKKSNKENKPEVPEDNMDSPVLDNPLLDPDWTKTPLARKVHRIRTINDQLLPKRTSKGGCSCKGNCERKTCGCRKYNLTCSSGCRCNSENCVNRKKDLGNKHEESIAAEKDEQEESNRPFKRTRLFSLASEYV